MVQWRGRGGWKTIALLLGRKGNVKKPEVLAAWDHAPSAGRVSPVPRESWQQHWPQPPCRPWGLGSRIAAGQSMTGQHQPWSHPGASQGGHE